MKLEKMIWHIEYHDLSKECMRTWMDGETVRKIVAVATMMTLREKLMHYTYDLDCCSNLKQEAITAIEDIAQYMNEDELLHHSRPLAIAYLALTEDVSVPVTHGRWIDNGG